MTLITPSQADSLAEKTISEYCQSCGVESPEDIRKVCEMLISKAARAIERYNGTESSIGVLNRTALYIAGVRHDIR